MFTSDGFLIGVYRTARTRDEYNAAIAREQQGGGPLSWVPMQYCPGRCCGTWVADDLDEQLLTPAADNSSVQVVPVWQLTYDSTPSFSKDNRFNQVVMTRFCTLAEGQNNSSVAPATTQQQQKCPRRCQVACCAKFAIGEMHFDRDYEFEQCAFSPCAYGCSLPGNSSATFVASCAPPSPRPRASPPYNVLKRQSLRAASAVGSNLSMGANASGAATSSGSLS
jgi:hypothetical protein